MRVDQWLWSVRVYKTRTASKTALKAGRVSIDGQPVKPAREVRSGEIVAANFGGMTRTFRVVDTPPSRIGAKLVARYAEELTSEEQFQRAREQARADRDWRAFRRSGA